MFEVVVRWTIDFNDNFITETKMLSISVLTKTEFPLLLQTQNSRFAFIHKILWCKIKVLLTY